MMSTHAETLYVLHLNEDYDTLEEGINSFNSLKIEVEERKKKHLLFCGLCGSGASWLGT